MASAFLNGILDLLFRFSGFGALSNADRSHSEEDIYKDLHTR